MTFDRRTFLACCAAMTAPVGGARAAGWPDRPITVVVPYAAGATGTVVMQLLAEQMGAKLGQPIVVEPSPGAGGNIGAGIVAAAAPTGYTLLVGATNNFVINQFLFANMKFDPMTAFEPVTRLVEGEKQKLLRLEEVLHERVIGQNEAVSLVTDAILRELDYPADEIARLRRDRAI